MTLFGIRPAFWPTVITIPCLIVLVLLGSWQTQRLFWKQAIIEERTERASGPAELFPGAGPDPDVWEFKSSVVTGTFDHSQEMYLMARTMRGNVGFHVITPLVRADTGATVLVNRGWVPVDYMDPTTRLEGQVKGEVTVAGVARRNQIQHWLVPDNEPERNRWFWMDVPGMAAYRNVSLDNDLYMEAGPVENPGGLPIGGQAKINLPNNHLQYAFTWYAMAVILLVIYVLYHRKIARETAV